MNCPHCGRANDATALFCAFCGDSLTLAQIEILQGPGQGQIHFVRPRNFTIGRADHHDLCLQEPSVSRDHARLLYDAGKFLVEDVGSRFGVVLDGAKVKKAPLGRRSEMQLGAVTLRFELMAHRAVADRGKHQQLLLSVVEAINSTRVLTEVLERILDAVMTVTSAERGFLFLTEDTDGPAEAERLDGWILRATANRTDNPAALPPASSVLRRVRETGQIVATGNALHDPTLMPSDSLVQAGLRTIVCIPLLSPRAQVGAGHALVGAIYVDNHAMSARFGDEILGAAEALARHASLAIENARLFESEQRTIRELERARDKALEASRAKGAFLATMSHELHTPLNAIIGYAEMLMDLSKERGQADAVADLEKLLEAGRHLLRLVDDVLDVSSLEEGRLTLHPEDISVATLVSDVAATARELLVRNGNTLTIDAPEALGRVRIDGRRLFQALRNVVQNAAKFTEQGRINVSARRERAAGTEWLTFEVKDTGIGMTDDQASKVFDPFTQADSSSTRRHGGAGLGLALTRRLCEAMGGRVSVRSETGQGSVFTVRVPALPVVPAPAAAPAPTPSAS